MKMLINILEGKVYSEDLKDFVDFRMEPYMGTFYELTSILIGKRKVTKKMENLL